MVALNTDKCSEVSDSVDKLVAELGETNPSRRSDSEILKDMKAAIVAYHNKAAEDLMLSSDTAQRALLALTQKMLADIEKAEASMD